MRRERGHEIQCDPQSVVTTGTFDGVHLGHQSVLRYLVNRALEVGGVPTVVTFDPHPRQVLTGSIVPLLTTLDERCDLLESLGIQRVVVVPFTRDLARMAPDDYVRNVLLETVGMREIVIGHDHRFGRGGSGNRSTLEALALSHEFGVDVMPAHVAGGVTVSSTAIRRLLLEDGDAKRATALLGAPYALRGTVVRGDQRGRDLGFPTANVEPSSPNKLIPKSGVYAVRARLENGLWKDAMMNIGKRPTFEDDGATKIEVNLFDTDGDFYGQQMTVELIARIRDERRFDGVQALMLQLREDRGQAAAALATLP